MVPRFVKYPPLTLLQCRFPAATGTPVALGGCRFDEPSITNRDAAFTDDYGVQTAMPGFNAHTYQEGSP